MTLFVVLVGVFSVAMAIAGTGVALPRIGADLEASGAALQWAVTGYNLALSAFTLVCGSLADLFGRRRMFVGTTLLFGVGSLVCALAPHILVLDVARAAAGIGAGGLMASGGALLAATFEGAGRTKAFAAMGATGGAGVVLGPFLAGWLVTVAGWRVSFLMFVVAAVIVLAGSLFVAESRGAERQKVDRPGVVLFVAGLALVLFGLIQIQEGGWTAPLGLLAGLVLLGVFVWHERRVDNPVLNLGLVRNAPFVGWCLGTVSTSVGFIGILVFLPIYLQGVDGLSAAEAGQILIMLTAPVLLAPMPAGWLVGRGVSARGLMVLSLLLVAAGNAWLTTLSPGVTGAELFGPLVTVGLGVGISFGITDAQAMNQVPGDQVGMAAGFLNTIRNSGEALVITVFGTALVLLLQLRIGSSELATRVAAGEIAGPDAGYLATQFTGSWHTALWIVCGYCLVAAAAVLVLLRTRRPAPSLTSTTV